MTSYEEALKWIQDTKISARSWSFGSNPRDIRDSVTRNRDAKGIADSYSYQVDMALQQTRKNEERMKIREEYGDIQALLDKRRDCLEVISKVAKMEDLFSTLSSDVELTALDLSNKPHSSVTSTKPASDLFSSDVVAENCMKGLQDSWNYLHSLAQCTQVHLQNASHYHQFWHEIEESKEWLEYRLSKVPELFSAKASVTGTSHQIRKSLNDIMKILKEYLQWQTRLDILFERAKHVVPLRARSDKLTEPRQAQVLIDYKTKEFELQAGDVVTLIDNSNAKKWKVRMIEKESEGSVDVIVPAIIILIPPTDPSALDASLRLRLQMLAIWSSTTRVLGKHVTRVLLEVFKDWNENKNSECGSMNESQRNSLLQTLGYMDDTLGCSLKSTPIYKELLKRTQGIVDSIQHKECSVEGDNHKVTVVVQVNYLQRFLQRYWDFWTYCDAYRMVLEDLRQPKNIFLCNNSTQLRYVTTAHFVKFWDCDLEDRSQWSVTVEGDSISADQTDALHAETNGNLEEEEEEFFESGVTEQKTETEEMIESEMEVETTFVITGIVSNPGREPEKIISLQDAIDKGIIDANRGLYVNKTTYISIPISQAMNEGFIKMGPKEEKKSEEKVKSAGIITVRSTRETRPYTVDQALDTRTGEMISAKLACVRGILDPDHGTYKDLKKGTVMLVGDAVQHRLVEIEYEANNNNSKQHRGRTKSGMVMEEVSKTYLVHAVVCQQTKSKLAFHEAVQKGLIEKDTGAYMNNATGERMFVVDAISKGFVIASESDDAPSLNVSDLPAKQNSSSGRRLHNPLTALQKPARQDTNSRKHMFNGNSNNNTSYT